MMQVMRPAQPSKSSTEKRIARYWQAPAPRGIRIFLLDQRLGHARAAWDVSLPARPGVWRNDPDPARRTVKGHLEQDDRGGRDGFESRTARLEKKLRQAAPDHRHRQLMVMASGASRTAALWAWLAKRDIALRAAQSDAHALILRSLLKLAPTQPVRPARLDTGGAGVLASTWAPIQTHPVTQGLPETDPLIS
jgi:hypothetical protein